MFGLTPYESRKNSLSTRRPRDIFDYFFNDDFMPVLGGNFTSFKTDIKENEKAYVLEAEMPGVTKGDIKLDLNEDVLTISIERKEEKNEEKGNYIRRERHYGSCSRSFRIDNVKHEGIDAKFDNGVLIVTLPKLQEIQTEKRSIDIK
jgi:HSP20 family protein